MAEGRGSGAVEIAGIKARLELDMRKFSEGMTRAKRELTDVDGQAKKASRSFEGLASALTAIGAGASLVGLIRTVGTLVREANELSMAMRGLAEVSKSLGVNVKETTDLAEEFANRGIMSIAEASNAVKTALSSGLNLEQTRELINATADAAAYNREAHLGWGEAVVQVMRGIKSGNSELTDAAGITTNLSVMYDRYAKTIGTTAAKLTEAQKVQAAYSGIMEESALFAGNADTALQGFTGTQTEFTNTMRTARTELGEAYLPAVEKMLETVTPLIKEFSGWVSENKDVVAGLTGATAATLAMGTAVSVLTTALRGLGIAMGPVGWAATLLGTVAVGIAAYSAAADTASTSAKEFAAANEELNASLAKTGGVLNAAQYSQVKEQMEQLNTLLERRKVLEEELGSTPGFALKLADMTEGLRGTESAATALYRELKDIDKALDEMGYGNVERAEVALRSMEKQTDRSLGALVSLTRQEMQSNLVAADKVKTLKSLSGEYDTLSKKESLSASDKQRLADVVKKLKSEYPELLASLDEEGRWIIKNTDALKGFVTGEENRVNVAIEAAKRIIGSEKILNQERVRLASEAMTALEQIESRNPKPAPFLNDAVGGLLTFSNEQIKKKLNEQINQGRFEINEAAKLLEDLAMGPDAFRTPVDTGTSADSGKGKDSKPASTAEQLAQAAYQSALKQMEMLRLLGQLTEAEEEKRLAGLAEKYKKFDDIWIDAESRRQRVVEQMAAASAKLAEDRARTAEQAARASFERSADWIEQESRRMTLAGESDEAIAQMRMEAWTRVRNRYAKDTEYYKRADTELYQLRVDLMKKTESAAEETRKQARKTADDVIKAIDKQKKAELDAIDERRKAIREMYEEQADLIDDGERLRERADLVSEIARYQAATSEQGRRHLAELRERLRKMDLDDQRRALDDERDEKLAALDEQQSDIESWYEETRALLDEYNGDFIKIYQQTEDERYKAFTTTNESILAELERFKTEYESVMSGIGSGKTASVVAQMAANAKAWHDAKVAGDTTAMATAANDNKALGASIGATYNSGLGRWFGEGGTPLFHTGRDGDTGRTFNAGDILMPDEITAILRRDEYVFTPGQLRSLIDGAGGRGGGDVYHIERVVGLEMNDARIEDEIDLRALGRAGADAAAEMRRSGFQTTGGGSV